MTPPPLIGTYPTPAVRLGRGVWCEYRGKWCRVTSFTEGLIPWPRCQPEKQRGGSGLWVNEELVRAIRTESAAALAHWFGMALTVAVRWREWAGVTGRTTTPGTRRSVKAAADAGADVTRGVGLSDEQCDQRSATSRRLKLIEHAQAKRWPEGWTADMDALLGTATDQSVAKKVGTSRAAVRARRHLLACGRGECRALLGRLGRPHLQKRPAASGLGARFPLMSPAGMGSITPS
jgi:hypothetical protein